MTNILQDCVTWLGGQLKDHCGVSVTYSRGVQSVSLTATVELHDYQIINDEGLATSIVSRDYILHAADVVISGSVVAPRVGDRIAETVGGTVCTFEVLPPGPGFKEYEPLDTDRTLLRVHTKLVGT